MRRLSLAFIAGIILMSSWCDSYAADWPEPDQLPEVKEFPDPLVNGAGQRVQSEKAWLQERRLELKAMFQHYMYGAYPAIESMVQGEVIYENRAAFDGKGTLREVKVSIAEGCPPIYLLLAIPNKAKAPVPTFVGMNFTGNHSLVNDPKIRIPNCWIYPGPGVKDNRATEEARGKNIETWALDQSISRGYAVATFYNGDVDPDDKNERGGMRPFLKSKGVQTATIMAWAWGIHRVVDYLTTLKEIDGKRIAVVGHSRLGKTALLAAAFDDRIALSIPHQAGCGGTAPNRSKNPKAESVQRINTSFPHWFNDNFKKFNERVEKLPFDQHCLVAIVAPRPVLFTNAVEDQWANPEGQFDILKAAEPVYKLLGAQGVAAEKMPEPGKLIDSTLGYYIREGKHSMTREDWKVFLDFADKNMK